MKVDTVEQFKILEFLKENFQLEHLKIELLNRNVIQVTDENNESMLFKYENGEVIWR